MQIKYIESILYMISRIIITRHYYNISIQSNQIKSNTSNQIKSKQIHQIMTNTINATLNYYFSPRQRLDTLFLVHSSISILVGSIGYLYPSRTMGFIFLTETDREVAVGRAMYRPTCALILAQGVIIWRARSINDGQIKRAFVQAYFICFFLCTLSFINEHTSNSGVVSGKFVGTIQIILMMFLTAGYAWFTFFQPPSVFQGLAMRRTAP